jgi:quinol-cytochrome oxidoreductase complex cytochrome b subunit
MILLAIAFFVGAAISILTQGVMWLTIGLFTFGALLFCAGLIVPAILLILKQPHLAYAWLRGSNPLVYANVHWEELSDDKRRSVYIHSMIALAFAIAFIVWVMSE